MDARDRILDEGAGALSELDLVNVLVEAGKRECVADRLLEGGLISLRRRTAAEILRTPGLPPAQALRLIAALELGRRALSAQPVPRRPLLRAEAVAALLWPRIAHLPHEEFWAVLLTARLEEMRSVRIASGGLTQCSVLPREAFAPSLFHGAPCVAFAHNHPSGDPAPSGDDHRVQLLLDEVGRALGVRVIDHLVLAEDGVHSAREGLLRAPHPSLSASGSLGE